MLANCFRMDVQYFSAVSPAMRLNTRFFVPFRSAVGEIETIIKDSKLMSKGKYKPRDLKRMFEQATEGECRYYC